MKYRLAEDSQGLAIYAEDIAAAYAALGHAHGKHRPLQARILHTAGRGALSQHLLGIAPLLALDTLVHRLDIPRHAARAAGRVDETTRAWVTGYCEAFARGLREASVFERTTSAALLMPTLESMLGGLLISSYLGLAQGQERMERALIEAVAQGAEPALLELMHAPYLQGFAPETLKNLPRTSSPGHNAQHFLWAGGSNAWGVSPERSASGRALLCGDPHLQINQLPSLFFEARVRLPDNYWLGVTIPGLAGLAIARTKHIAWSGTFSVADNVDWFVEDLASSVVTKRRVSIARRGKTALQVDFSDTERGVIEAVKDQTALSVAWAGSEAPDETLSAYLRLPLCKSAPECVSLMDGAMTLALHFVIADAAGEVWYRQVGRIPKREHVSLAPRSGKDGWERLYRGDELPRFAATEGFIATANEHRTTQDGATLSTLFQPDYRLKRIEEVLRARTDHDVQSMQSLQLDLVSLQAQRLKPLFIQALGDHSLATLLQEWNDEYDLASVGAVAFERLYTVARNVLAERLGGEWMKWMLHHSELHVWWCRALDTALLDPVVWQGEHGDRLSRALRDVKDLIRPNLADMQRYDMPHMLLGQAPFMSRADLTLPGSRATVRQGTQMTIDGGKVVVGPAYRFITDFSEDAIWAALPGGIDGSPLSSTYTLHLDGWRNGTYRKLTPPTP